MFKYSAVTMVLGLAASGAVLVATAAGSDNVRTIKSKLLITKDNSHFGAGIEGTGVDPNGAVYAVNFNNNKNSTGTIAPQQAEFFTGKPADSVTDAWYNGIRFTYDRESRAAVAYVVDVSNHHVVQVTGDASGSRSLSKLCGDPKMLQPNDLAIAYSNNRIFLSGMNYTATSSVGDGDLWTCLPGDGGKATLLGKFYRTNGIEVSPDEKTLYLSEAQNKDGTVISNVIWKFDLDAPSGSVSNKQLFVDFGKLDNTAATDVDGMRCDSRGNLYVSRNGIGKVAKFSPSGSLLAYIELEGIDFVGNLELGGRDGKTLYMVGRCKDDETKGCVESIKVDVPGLAFTRLSSYPGNGNSPSGKCKP